VSSTPAPSWLANRLDYHVKSSLSSRLSAMKIFVLGLPHTQTTTKFTCCAFTMKVWNLCRMMKDRGHEVVHLGTEGSNPPCTEHVSVTPEKMWGELYGHPGTGFFHFETDGKYQPYTDLYVSNVRKAIAERVSSPHSAIVCVPWGGAQQVAVQHLDQFVVESGIGYPYTWAKWRVFESYAWMHMHLGKENRFGGDCWYWVVIPNAFDLDMFRYEERKGDYFLYLGRLIDSKGVGIAVDACRDAGVRLKIVGPGNPEPFVRGNPHVEYLPPVGVEDRREILAGARGLFCPTRYVEPFGGVVVEAQLSGTPVITSDFGVFPETVLHGYTGYRCRTREHFDWAVRNVEKLSPRTCRTWAEQNFSLEVVGRQYEEYFRSLLDVDDADGWNRPRPERKDLSHIGKIFPPTERPIR